MEKQDTYYIAAEYFFFSGTYGAPRDGAIRDWDGRRIEFGSRKEAVAHLSDEEGEWASMGCTENADGSWSRPGCYMTAHGEYERPCYWIKKARTRKLATA